jgi:two-component system, NtrC family, response regulator AlgB
MSFLVIDEHSNLQRTFVGSPTDAWQHSEHRPLDGAVFELLAQSHGLDRHMRHALNVAFSAAATDATILVRGESGTGKSVLARAIHAHSARSANPFVAVHCPSLTDEMLESELFGHVTALSPDTAQGPVGKIASAEGGTLFLDEIGDLSIALQPKVLRLLQESRYERVGETQARVSNVRVLAATARALEADVAAGRFREDLFYRLNVIEVSLPPLRQRTNDILPLAEELLRFLTAQCDKVITGFDALVKQAFVRYLWPGNVRELRNAIERGTILSPGPSIQLCHLPPQIVNLNSLHSKASSSPEISLEQIEFNHIRRVLASTATLEEAAAQLGINPSTLYRKRKKYGM